MNEPRRPDLDQSAGERLRNHINQWRQNRRLDLSGSRDWGPHQYQRRRPRSDRVSDPGAGPSEPNVSGERRGPAGGLVVATIGTGLVLVVAASVWGWNAWSSRSSPRIDDQLPFLVNAESAPDATSGASASVAAVPVSDGDSVNSADPINSADGGNDAAVAATPAMNPAPTVAPTLSDQDAAPLSSVVVHVSGAVVAPGVVELSEGARVFEAVDAAGGQRVDADLDRVNLAAPLQDGERIHIPYDGELEPPQLVAPDRAPATSTLAGAGEPDASQESPLLVDLNRASVSELEQLPGVGPAIAQAIADLREKRGPYATVDELLLVGGVGPTKLAALRAFAIAG